MTYKDLGLPIGIPEDQFMDLTRKFVTNIKHARDNVDLQKNVLDPFSAIIEAKMNGQSLTEWMVSEKTRQSQKSLSNHLGTFHQELLGILPGWESTGSTGGNYDLIHPKPFYTKHGMKPVIAEVKNKHNTMNSNSANNLRTNFNSYLRQPELRGFIAYLIQIIPKNREKIDVPWKVSGFGEIPEVRIIDAATIYSRSTDDQDAFKKVFSAIPIAMDRIIGTSPDSDGDYSPWERIFSKSIEFRY